VYPERNGKARAVEGTEFRKFSEFGFWSVSAELSRYGKSFTASTDSGLCLKNASTKQKNVRVNYLVFYFSHGGEERG
jgi:hypothetical protein